MTGPVTTEALVEALAAWILSRWPTTQWQAKARAKAIVAGPLAPLIAAHQQVTAERDEARADQKAAEDSNDALNVKLHALAPHGSCACSYDKPGDVCMHHSPALAAATSELARLRAEGEAKDRALKPFADYADFAERHEWPKDIAEDPTTPVLGRAGWDGEIACEVTVGDFLAARAATAREG